MKKFFYNLTVVIFLILVLSNCNYDEERSNDIAAVWKNGIRQTLSTSNRSSHANSIIVSGNDVYIAGFDDDIATIWKNGIAQTLQRGWRATSLFIIDDDIYVTGSTPSNLPLLWKNGVDRQISNESGSFEYYPSIFISGTDVYIAFKNTVWKNYEILYNFSGTVSSVFISEGDIYVVGAENGKATIWKNGVKEILPEGNMAISVIVIDNNVFAVGNEKVWKNGKVLYTIPSIDHGTITSFFVSNNDIYVTTEYSVLKNGVVIQNATKSKYYPSFTEVFSSIYVVNSNVYVVGYYNISTRVKI